MRTEEVIVRSVLTIVLSILVWIVGLTANGMGADRITIIVVCTLTFFIGLSFSAFLKIIKKNVARAFFIISVLSGITFYVVHAHLITLCGDGYCAAEECTTCQLDCTANQCQNGICDLPMESCANSLDCSCAKNEICAPNQKRNISRDIRGCYTTSCGDGYCDTPETQDDCCIDCGCKNNFLCLKNTCYFDPPKITITAYALTDVISATSLAGNPLLTREDGKANPFMVVNLRASGYVDQVQVTFTIPNMIENTVDVPWSTKESEHTANWFIAPDQRLLNVTSDTKTKVITTIKYRDAQGDYHNIVRSTPLTILNRDTLDEQGDITLFVTNNIITSERTPETIWDNLRKNLTLLPQHDSVQFPSETVALQAGSRRDIAVLYASAYETAGYHPSFVESPQGLFVRLPLVEGNILLDPTAINKSFVTAQQIGIGTRVIEIEKVRSARNFTILSVPQ